MALNRFPLYLSLIFLILPAACRSLPPVVPLNSQLQQELGTNKMQAVVASGYGEPLEILRMKTVDIPQPGPEDVLIKVKYAALNPMEHHIMTGNFFGRLDMGLFSPAVKIFGADLSGVVVATGDKVTQFKKGDEVLAYSNFHAFAQFAVVRFTGVWKKPKNISFKEAAALPLAGVTALYGLQTVAKLKKGESVLVNGASGGVGIFAVQIAKALGAKSVTGVSSQRNHEMVRGIGADNMIDYKKEEFPDLAQKYDVVIDLVGNYSAGSLRDSMNEKGRAVILGYDGFSTIFHGFILGPITGMFSDKDVTMAVASIGQPDLAQLAKMCENGTLKPVIDREYSFAEIPQAVTYLGKRHASGKVVVQIGD